MNSPTEKLPEAPKDLRRICPFLGLMDDPETSLAFPAEINYCHAAEPPGVPRFDHQSTHCLALAYLGCPVYSAKEKGPLPAEIRLKIKGNGPQIRIQGPWFVRTIGAFIIATLIFFIGWFGVAGITRNINETAAAKTQAGFPALANCYSIFARLDPNSQLCHSSTTPASPTGTETPTPPLVNPSNPQPAPVSCGRPAGWVNYTVRANDTLFQLSLSFGVTVTQLQSANCLGTSTILHVGRTLYVPPWAMIPVVPTLEPTWPVPLDIPTETLTPEPTATVYEPPFAFTTTSIPTDAQITPIDTTNP